jgi:hypothetical protein
VEQQDVDMLSILDPHFNVTSLLFTKREVITTEAEFGRITQGSPANHFNTDAIAETHFQQAAAKMDVALDGNDVSLATDTEFVQ